MREKLRIVLASKFAELASEATAIETGLQQISEVMRARTEAVEQLETAHTERTQRGYALEGEANQNRERLSAIALESDRSTARRANNEERCAELLARTVAAEAELTRTLAQLESLTQERETNRGILESAAADVAGSQAEAQAKREESLRAAAAVGDAEHRQETARLSVLDIISNANHVRNQVAQNE